MLKMKKIIVRAGIIIFVGLAFPVNMLLAHEGHHHSTSSDQKQPKVQQKEVDSHSEVDEKSKQPSDSVNQSKEPAFSVSEEVNKNDTRQQSTHLSIVPQTTEWAFILIVASPFLLKFIRQQIHNTNFN